ncbi:MAG: hypothetical protein GWP08_21435 [Nitrospiraceae bacterium]|nr:hypothetical protein [Nitrospiraceae bacterium]
MCRVRVCVMAAVLVTAAATAQQTPVIECESAATVDAMPTFVDFYLHLRATGDSLAEAAEAASTLKETLDGRLQAHQLSPSEVIFSGVAIPDANEQKAHASARLRFNASPFSTAEDGAKMFGGLCDTLAVVAKELGCMLEGPHLGTTDAQTVEEAAIARALEKAYPAGRAVAQTMNAQIYAVEKVEIRELVWNDAENIAATQPDIRLLTCTAKLRVSYSFASANP